MAKLLEYFEEQMKSDSELSTSIDKFQRASQHIKIDSVFNMTPDIAALRYSGPQYVFIWDDLKNPVRIDTCNQLDGIQSGVDLSTWNYSVRTQEKFLPFEDWSAAKGERPFILPGNPDWTDLVKVEDGIMKQMKPAWVGGRILEVNLKALIALDCYYGNTRVTTRQLKPVLKTNNVSAGPVWVWMYLERLDGLGKYDPHENKYILHDNLSPRPIRKVGYGTDYVYEVDAHRAFERPKILH